MGGGSSSVGTVFKLTPDGGETILFNFPANGLSGQTPTSGLTIGKGGDMYGVTQYGGTSGCGTVFKIDRRDRVQSLFSFHGSDGCQPWGGFTVDAAGILYGTTLYGGGENGGTVFDITPAGVETVLHNFQYGRKDGNLPEAPPQFDAAGNLYGGTYEGGIHEGLGTDCFGFGCG